MLIELSFKSGVPVYLQVVDQIKYLATAGALRDGDALPSIRELAQRLRVNRNTIAKAYTELERQRVIETIQGKGAYLSGNHSPFDKSVKKEILAAAIDAAIVQAHHFQVTDEKFLHLVRERLDEFQKRREGQ